MNQALGRKVWAIPKGWIPAKSNGPKPELENHEAFCVLNTGDQDAHIRLTIYFADREPVGPYSITVPARRAYHGRFNNLTDPAPVPRETDYASIIESDVPIVVQHTRLDSRQTANALLSTMAFPVAGA